MLHLSPCAVRGAPGAVRRSACTLASLKCGPHARTGRIMQVGLISPSRESTASTSGYVCGPCRLFPFRRSLALCCEKCGIDRDRLVGLLLVSPSEGPTRNPDEAIDPIDAQA